MKSAALAILALIASPVLCRAQSTLTFARVMQPADFAGTGFALVNPAANDATVTFTLYGDRGNPVQASIQTIKAGGQLSMLASELFPGATGGGWVQATSATMGLQGFWIGGNLTTFADSAEPATASNELIVPLVTINSELDIVNTGSSDVTVIIHLLGQDGTEMAVVPFPQRIVGRGFLRQDIAKMFVSDDFSQASHMRIECGCPSPSPFAATLISPNFLGGRDSVVTNGVPASTATTTLNFPHVVDGAQGTSANWRSFIGITNLSPTSSNDVTISFMSASGAVLRTSQRTIPPNGGIRGNARDYFAGGLPDGFQDGWVQISSGNSVPVTGFVGYVETIAGGSAVVPPQSEARSNLLFAHIADLPPFLTGLALLNTNPTTATVEISALNPNGSLIATRTFDIASGAKSARLLRDIIPETQTRTSDGGFVFVRSNVALYAIELFFSRDLKILSNVGAGRVLPGINYSPPAR